MQRRRLGTVFPKSDCNHDDEWSRGPSSKKWAIKYTVRLWAGLSTVMGENPLPEEQDAKKENKSLPYGLPPFRKTWTGALVLLNLGDPQSDPSMVCISQGLG